MKTKLVQIGNSRGIRIPRAMIEEARLEGRLELRLGPRGLVIQPAKVTREGWAGAFQRMADQEEDRLLDAEVMTPTGWEATDWVW